MDGLGGQTGEATMEQTEVRALDRLSGAVIDVADLEKKNMSKS